MEVTMSKFELSTYWSDDQSRTAVIFKEDDGYRVSLRENGTEIFLSDVTEHSQQYAEDLADNWVMRVGSFKESYSE
jgi:hypothetical protein